MPLTNSKYASYVPDLNDFEKQFYEQKIEKLSSEKTKTYLLDIGRMKKEYEIASKARGKQAAARLNDLTLEERIVLSIYGKFGLAINRNLRDKRIGSQEVESVDLGQAKRVLSDFLMDNCFTDPSDIQRRLGNNAKAEKRQRDLMDTVKGTLNAEDSRFLLSVTALINNIINEKKDRFSKKEDDILYRISRAEKNVFNSGGEDSWWEGLYSDNEYKWDRTYNDGVSLEKTIYPGDFVSDRAFNSTSFTAEPTIYRYGRDHKAATVKKSDRDEEGKVIIDKNIEEILFMIKNTPELPTIDISRHKFPVDFPLRKGTEASIAKVRERADRPITDEEMPDFLSKRGSRQKDISTSGEMLIAPNVIFRVLGVQHDRTTNRRKIVILEPVSKEQAARERIRIPYAGDFLPPSREAVGGMGKPLLRTSSVGRIEEDPTLVRSRAFSLGGLEAVGRIKEPPLFSRSRASSSEMGTAGGLENPLVRSRASSLEKERAERSWWKKLCCFK